MGSNSVRNFILGQLFQPLKLIYAKFCKYNFTCQLQAESMVHFSNIMFVISYEFARQFAEYTFLENNIN